MSPIAFNARALVRPCLVMVVLLLWVDALAAERVLRLRYEVVNPTSQPVTDATLDLYAPPDVATQTLSRVVVSRPHTEALDALGNRVLTVALPTLAPGGRHTVTVTAVLDIHDAKAQSAEATDRQAEPMLPSEDADVVALAKELGSADAKKAAKAFYRWVDAKVEDTGPVARDRGARFALDQKRGDCTEMAQAFVTLMRAGGHAARTVSGWVMAQSGLPDPTQFHTWAQFHDGHRFRVADPQKQKFMTAEGDFVVLRIGEVPADGAMAGRHRFGVNAPLRAQMVGGR